jgi:phosphonate dehydrogenase
MRRVVITQWIHPEVVDELRTFCEPMLNETREPLPTQELADRCREAEGLMVFMPDRIDRAFLEGCPRLRIVVAALKGCDNFDVEAMKARDISFYIQEDLLTVPTAELAIGLMLGLGRHILEGDAFLRSGAFKGWRPTFYGLGLQGQRVGILGFGKVGQALAERLRPFGAEVLCYDAAPRVNQVGEAHGETWVDLETLLATSDYLVPLLPLRPDTQFLLDRKALTRLKVGCLLVNVARGSLVDETAVADMLASGQLGGYAADVFEMEDWALEDRRRSIPEALLKDRVHTLFTPHLGSAVRSTRLAIEWNAARQLWEFFQGHP